jgi:hypothetical protein
MRIALGIVFLRIDVGLASRKKDGGAIRGYPGNFFRRAGQRYDDGLASGCFHRAQIRRQGAIAVFRIVTAWFRYGDSRPVTVRGVFCV